MNFPESEVLLYQGNFSDNQFSGDGVSFYRSPVGDRKIFLEQAFAIFFRIQFWLRICRPLRDLGN
jgi:hypothetical protein